MRQLSLALLILTGAGLNGQAPDLTSVGIDSATAWLENHVDDDGDEAYRFALELIQQAKAVDSLEDAAYASRNAAYWHYIHVESEIEDSILFYDRQAYAFFKLADNPLEAARSAGHVATSYSEKNRFKEAEEMLFDAINILDPEENKEQLADMYGNLCYVFRNARDFDSAIEYGERSLKLYTEMTGEDSLGGMVPLFYLAGTYILADQPEIALQRAERSLNMVNISGGDELVGESLRAYGFRGMALQKLGRLEEAMRDYRYAYNLALTAVPEPEMADGYKEGIGKILYLQGKYPEAIPYFEDYVAHMVERDPKDQSLIEIYQELGDAYAKTGNLLKAIAYKDSLYKRHTEQLKGEITATRSELRVRFAAAEKDEIIGAQEDTIGRQNRIQQLSYGIGALLLLGLGGLFWGLRNNRNKNELLEASNAEKELLLKEIHHRVKNNLEVISSLLELQSAGLTDSNAKEAMLASQNRVTSMGILHQKLYQGRSLKSIKLNEYFGQLANTILDTYGEGNRLNVNIEGPEIEMDVDTAIPLGLIVNELLTNAIKYAYPGADAGAITVSMSKVTETDYRLTVSDQGVGNDTNSAKGTGFGSRLVSLLATQLSGKLDQTTDDGLSVKLTFPYPPSVR